MSRTIIALVLAGFTIFTATLAQADASYSESWTTSLTNDHPSCYDPALWNVSANEGASVGCSADGRAVQLRAAAHGQSCPTGPDNAEAELIGRLPATAGTVLRVRASGDDLAYATNAAFGWTDHPAGCWALWNFPNGVFFSTNAFGPERDASAMRLWVDVNGSQRTQLVRVANESAVHDFALVWLPQAAELWIDGALAARVDGPTPAIPLSLVMQADAWATSGGPVTERVESLSVATTEDALLHRIEGEILAVAPANDSAQIDAIAAGVALVPASVADARDAILAGADRHAADASARDLALQQAIADGVASASAGAAGVQHAIADAQANDTARADALQAAIANVDGTAASRDLALQQAIADESVNASARHESLLDALGSAAAAIGDRMSALASAIAARFDAVDRAIADARADLAARLDGVGERLSGVDARLAAIEARLDGSSASAPLVVSVQAPRLGPVGLGAYGAFVTFDGAPANATILVSVDGAPLNATIVQRAPGAYRVEIAPGATLGHDVLVVEAHSSGRVGTAAVWLSEG